MNDQLMKSIRMRVSFIENISKRQLKGDMLALLKEIDRLEDVNSHLMFELGRRDRTA